jgi:hypothetical protein
MTTTTTPTTATATIALVSAAPGDALAALAEACGEVGPVERWAPLALPGWLGRAPGPLGRYAARRAGPGPAHPGLRAPHLLAVDAALRAWARDRTDRRYQADFLLRAAIDAWAAGEVRRRRPRIVIAPSLAARRTFAAARAAGAATVLVLDVPLLRALHRDLDRAAQRWPERAFLRRFRAPSWAIARQEAERVMADLVLVRGPYAHAACLADGVPEARLARLPQRPTRALPTPLVPTGRIRLAGLAAARHGVDTALAAARALGLELVVRVGEGTEPADLARRPGVTTAGGPVDAIVCPAICETYPEEVRASGVPVIASPMASLDGAGPDPFDPDAFADAIRHRLAARARPAHPPPPRPPPLAPRLGALL